MNNAGERIQTPSMISIGRIGHVKMDENRRMVVVGMTTVVKGNAIPYFENGTPFDMKMVAVAGTVAVGGGVEMVAVDIAMTADCTAVVGNGAVYCYIGEIVSADNAGDTEVAEPAVDGVVVVTLHLEINHAYLLDINLVKSSDYLTKSKVCYYSWHFHILP